MLLFTHMIQERQPRNGAEMTQILSDLLDDATSDAERAGERLLVVGSPEDFGRRYRVIGEDTGHEYVRVAIYVPDESSPVDRFALERLGLIMQMCLNGPEQTPPEEVDALQQLTALDAALEDDDERNDSSPH